MNRRSFLNRIAAATALVAVGFVAARSAEAAAKTPKVRGRGPDFMLYGCPGYVVDGLPADTLFFVQNTHTKAPTLHRFAKIRLA